MDLFQRYGNLLKQDGTNQQQRTLPALEAEYIMPDERTLSDLVEYARKLAPEVRYYNLNGQGVGDWRPLFELLLDPATGQVLNPPALETRLASRQDWPPHVTLFIVFLKLFQNLQTDLNELPQRHLRHYYEAELGLSRRGAAADEVHVIFELARNAAQTLLPQGTLLDAGKDSQGQSLRYATTADLVVSEATVADIRRTVTEVDRRGYRRFFVANSLAESEANSWNTFGSKQLGLDANRQIMTEAELGFAVSSPILILAEGARTIEVTATLQAIDSAELPSTQRLETALSLSLTGAEGWLVPDNFTAMLINISGQLSLQLTLSVNETAPAIIAFDSELHGSGPVSSWPLLRCHIKGRTGIYDLLEGLIMESATIKVDVAGVRNLVVQNADSLLSVDKPMPLFGNQPHIGSSFYIGSSEIFSKKLTYLSINMEWEAPPKNLFGHYQAYFDDPQPGLYEDFRGHFLFDLDLLYNRSWNHRILYNQALFSPNVTEPQRISAYASTFTAAFPENDDYAALPMLNTVSSYTSSSKYGFIRMVLQNPTQTRFSAYTDIPFEAFGHQAFPQRYANQAIALSKWESGDGTTKPELPNDPYTPVLASLALDYHAEVEFKIGNNAELEAFYLLGPFGYTEASKSIPALLVPEVEGQAALYMGIENLQAPANLSLLFQIEIGTAKASQVLKPGETHWSFLSGGQWQDLPATAVLNDSTYGFQKPGLVIISIPKEASTDHTTMPSNLVWLRAHIQRPPDSASRTMALHTQAIKAELAVEEQDLDSYAAHLQNGLPPKLISRMLRSNARIKKVTQPYASFDGQAEENNASYFRRCSERLRHRNRAITPWDFERLVLEAFPEVFKVKCLPHSDAAGNSKAGELALVIIPDLRSIDNANPLEPRAGAVLMGQINDYVASNLSTPYTTFHVIHPVYEHIRVDIHVAFLPGLDAGWYTNVLNNDLLHFLSPWADKQGEDIVFGARIYKSEILAFLEGRHYIDYVTDFNLYHDYAGPPREGIGHMRIGTDFFVRPKPQPAVAQMVIGEDFIVGRSVDVAHTTQPHAILVSHPQHLITPISLEEDRCSGVQQLGIGYMTIGLDFNVQQEYA